MKEIIEILSREERNFKLSEGRMADTQDISHMSLSEIVNAECDIAVSLDPEQNQEDTIEIIHALFNSSVKKIFIGVKLKEVKTEKYMNNLREIRDLAEHYNLEFVHFNYHPCRIGLVYGDIDNSLAKELFIEETEVVTEVIDNHPDIDVIPVPVPLEKPIKKIKSRKKITKTKKKN